MRKFYASLLTGLACLTAFNASAYKATLEVDNPDVVTATFNGSALTFTDGVAEIEFDGYQQIQLSTTLPNVLVKLEQYVANSDSPNSAYLSSATEGYAYLSGEYYDGCRYVLTTGNLEDLRTASVILNVDEPSAITFTRSWTNESFTPTEKQTVIKYVPGKEEPFGIRTASGKNLYKLTVGGEEVSGYYGSYSIYNVKDGDVIDAVVAYPDIKCALKFNLSEKCQEGFITEVTVDGTPLNDWRDAQVQIGSQVSVTFDANNYNITKFDLNGQSISGYGYYYSPYTFIMNSDATFDIEAAPYGKAEMTFNVDKASYVILYKGYNYSDPSSVFPLQNGSTTISIGEKEGPLKLRATSEAVITSVTQDGSPLSADYNNEYTITVRDGSVIDIEAEEIRRDDTLVFYFDSPEKASDSSNGLYGYSFETENRRQISLNAGYNIVKFGAVDGDEFRFSVYGGKTDNVFFYINGKEPEYTSDYMSLNNLTPANGDVYKCFVGARPESYSLSFTVADNLKQPEVTVDKITKLTSLDPISVFEGTAVSIAPAEGNTFKSVKVGDTEIAPADGLYEFTVNADSPVTIEAGEDSSVIGIEAEEAEKVVYNLQGIRVDAQKLPAGLYIINGKKVLVK